MFSVYGVMGRLFSGSLDQMGQVGGVNTLTRTRAIAPIGREPSASDTGDNLRRVSGAGAAEAAPHSPIAAYVQVQSGDVQRHPLTRVRDVMSRKLITVPLQSTLHDGWQRLSDQGVGQAPVVDDKGMLVGMLLRADLLRHEHLPGPHANPLVWRAWLAKPVAEVMWTPVPSALAQTELRQVARVLIDTGLPGLPVVDAEGTVAGFVSRTDLLRAIVNDPPLDLWS
jgi:CBS-domain-containing membrane protein